MGVEEKIPITACWGNISGTSMMAGSAVSCCGGRGGGALGPGLGSQREVQEEE